MTQVKRANNKSDKTNLHHALQCLFSEISEDETLWARQEIVQLIMLGSEPSEFLNSIEKWKPNSHVLSKIYAALFISQSIDALMKVIYPLRNLKSSVTEKILSLLLTIQEINKTTLFFNTKQYEDLYFVIFNECMLLLSESGHHIETIQNTNGSELILKTLDNCFKREFVKDSNALYKAINCNSVKESLVHLGESILRQEKFKGYNGHQKFSYIEHNDKRLTLAEAFYKGFIINSVSIASLEDKLKIIMT